MKPLFQGNVQSKDGQDAWLRLRGVLKDVFAAFGGGEAYLQHERENSYSLDSASKEGR